MPSPYEHYQAAEQIMERFDVLAKEFEGEVQHWVKERPEDVEDILDDISKTVEALKLMTASAQVHATLATYQGTLPTPDPVEVPE